MESVSREQQQIFERAYAHYQADGEWPLLADLQRELAGDEPEIHVRAAIGEAGVLVFLEQPDERVRLSLRAISLVPAARPLLDAYLLTTQELIRRFRDPDGDLTFSSADLKRMRFDEGLERDIARLLVDDHWGLGSGSGSVEEGWSYKIDDRVLYASKAATVEELLAVRYNEPPQPPAPAVSPLRSGPPPGALDDGDEPIAHAVQDLLGRVRVAELLAAEATSRPRSRGFVLGISGPWGSGKTSLLNLIQEKIEAEESGYVVRFDPWLFSNTEELVLRFLRELAAQLKRDHGLRKLAGSIADYGALLAPLTALSPMTAVGPAFAVFTGFLSRWAKRPMQASALGQREQVRSALRDLGKPLVVMIDDIDRLDRNEIRDVFRLVKLVADFPNTVYVLAFDQERVARALSDEYEYEDEGYAFLEKIVQRTQDVPAVPPITLERTLTDAMSAAIGDISRYKFSQDAYAAVFGGVSELFATVRDVRRYATELPGILALLGAEVELADVLALEALRARAPASFGLLATSKDALTFSALPAALRPKDDGRAMTQVDAIVQAGGAHSEAVATIIRGLFPVAGRHLGGSSYGDDWLPNWRRERRVAHREVFDIYLNRALPPGVLPVKLVEQVVELMEDAELLSRLLDNLDGDQLESLLERLEHYEAGFPRTHPEVPIATIYNQQPRMRQGRRNVLDPGTEAKVSRVVLRLLRNLDEQEVTRAVRAALPNIRALSAKRDLLRVVGSHDGVGSRIITEGDEAQLEAELVDQLLQADLSPGDRSDAYERFPRPREWTGREPNTREAQQAYAGADHS